MFTAVRLPKEEPGSAPAASPQVRRRPSPWPPGQRVKPARKFPPRHPPAGKHRTRPTSARFEPVTNLKGVITPVPRVLLFVSLAGPAPSGSTGTSRLCQGCFPPSPAPPGSGCPQLQPPAATGRRWRSLTPTRNNSASRRTYSVGYSVTSGKLDRGQVTVLGACAGFAVAAGSMRCRRMSRMTAMTTSARMNRKAPA